jgi:hypothetical protein
VLRTDRVRFIEHIWVHLNERRGFLGGTLIDGGHGLHGDIRLQQRQGTWAVGVATALSRTGRPERALGDLRRYLL